MDYTKIDSTKLELTTKQIIYDYDLMREKETLEARLVVINAMLAALK